MLSFTLQAITIYFIVLMTSLPLIDGVSEYDQKRIFEIFILSLTLLVNIFNKTKFAGNNLQHKLFLIVVIIGLVSSFFAQEPHYSFIEVSLFIGLWSVVIYTANLDIKYKNNQILLIFGVLIIAAITIYLASFFVGYFAAFNEDSPKEWLHIFRGFVNIRFFNQFQVWTLPILTLVFILKPFGLKRWNTTIAVMMAAWWMLLFLSAGRGVMLASFSAMLIIALLYRQYSVTFIRTHITFAISGFLLFQVFFVFIPQFSFSDSPLPELLRTDSPGRLVLWMQSIELITKNPVLGVGPMHFSWYPNGIASHPHSSILQWAAEWGIPSMLLMLGLFCYGLHSWLKRFNYSTISSYSNEDSQIIIALSCSLLSGLGLSLVSGVIVMPMSQIMMVIIIGLMIGFYTRFNVKESDISNREYTLWKLFYLCSLALLLTTTWPSLSARLLSDEFVPEMNGVVSYGPRLWRIGGIPHD